MVPWTTASLLYWGNVILRNVNVVVVSQVFCERIFKEYKFGLIGVNVNYPLITLGADAVRLLQGRSLMSILYTRELRTEPWVIPA